MLPRFRSTALVAAIAFTQAAPAAPALPTTEQAPPGCTPAEDRDTLAVFTQRRDSDDLAALVALRIGLCDLMRRGLLDIRRAGSIFEEQRGRLFKIDAAL